MWSLLLAVVPAFPLPVPSHPLVLLQEPAQGTAQAEAPKSPTEIVERCLLALAAAQGTDGTWGEGDVHTTALALLAFTGDGNVPREGPFQNQVREGLRGLLRRTAGKADLVPGNPKAHAIAMGALADIYRYTESPKLQVVLQNAAEHLSTQDLSASPGLLGWSALSCAALRATQADLPEALTKKLDEALQPGAGMRQSLAISSLAYMRWFDQQLPSDLATELRKVQAPKGIGDEDLMFLFHAQFQVSEPQSLDWYRALVPHAWARVQPTLERLAAPENEVPLSKAESRTLALQALSLQAPFRLARAGQGD